jgi:hypothetical protein
MAHTSGTPTRTIKFWTNDTPKVELTRESTDCPVRGCTLTSHPVRVAYQYGTSAPGVYWDCGRHKIFSCSVQEWRPFAHMQH